MSAIVRMRTALVRPVLAWGALVLAAVIGSRVFGEPHLAFGSGRAIQVRLASDVLAPGQAIVSSLPSGRGSLGAPAGGLPGWLQNVLLLTAFTAVSAFAVEPALALARRRKLAGPAGVAGVAGASRGGRGDGPFRPGSSGRSGRAARPGAHGRPARSAPPARPGRHRAPSRAPVWSFGRAPGRGTADVPARGIADAPGRGAADAYGRVPVGVPPQVSRAAAAARIVRAHHERLVVTYSPSDHTVYVLTPPGSHPRAVLDAARLVLPESAYYDLAGHLGFSYA